MLSCLILLFKVSLISKVESCHVGRGRWVLAIIQMQKGPGIWCLHRAKGAQIIHMSDAPYAASWGGP
jgi:hypothetical protein